MPIDHREFLAQLARRGKTQVEFAQERGIRPSTLSAWARGVNPAPPRFRQDLEDALGLRRGALKPKPATLNREPRS